MFPLWFASTGHAMWPAVVLNESNIGASQGLKPARVDKSVLVQFFGTHDFARFHAFLFYGKAWV